MKKILLFTLLFVAIGTISVSAKKKFYKCSYFIEELDSAGVLVSDSTMDIALSASETKVSFAIQNKTKRPMFIDWEQSALVINGVSERCVHSGVKYTDKEKSQSKSVLAPSSMFSDILIPACNISFNDESYKTHYRNPHWETRKIFNLEAHNKDDEEQILAQEGMKIGVMLAIEINGTIDYKYYTIVLINFREGES